MDNSQFLQNQVQQAITEKMPLNIIGGNTKQFYGRLPQGQPLSVLEHRGIIDYEPSELVMTARCGTPIQEIESVLAAQGQMLAFEPPIFGTGATLGGTVACGLSGARRPFTGAVRDFVLGCTLLNGRAEILRFGGQVMKNVAGYDVSRLMAGAMGTLGILLDISLKVLPKPQYELTIRYDMNVNTAIETMNHWASLPLPLSAQCYYNQQLYIRLSGAETAVTATFRKLGGEIVSNEFFKQLSQHQLDFFKDNQPHFDRLSTRLWRLSLAPNTPMLPLSGQWLLDWGGAQRWLNSELEPATIFQTLAELNGHATLFKRSLSLSKGCHECFDNLNMPSLDRETPIFQPLSPVMLKLQQNLKKSFDPHSIFNPQRLYLEI